MLKKTFNLYEEEGAAGSGGGDHEEKKVIDKAEFDKVVGQRQDLKKDIESLTSKLEQYEKEKKDIEDAKLQEQGKLKELLDSRTTEFETEKTRLESELEKLKPRAEAFDRIETQERENAKKVLGEEVYNEGKLDNVPIETIRVMMKTANSGENFDFDSAVKHKKEKTVLTDSQKKDAARMNVTEEVYIELLNRNKKE